MNLRYTKRALRQIDATLAYIQQRSPQGADNVRHRLLAIVALLQHQPYAGHATSRRGVLRIGLLPYPYVIDCRATDSETVIQRFRHSARRPVG